MPNSLFPDNTFPDSTEFPFSIDYGKFGNVIYDDTIDEPFNYFSLNSEYKLDKEIKYNSKIENIQPPEKIYKPYFKRISKNVSENETLQTKYFINNYGNEYVPDKLIETSIQNKIHNLYQGNVFQHFSLTKNQDYIIFPSNEISSDLSIIPISRKYKCSLNTSLNLNKTTVVPFSSTINQVTRPHIISDEEFLLSVRRQSKINFVKFRKNTTQIDNTDIEDESNDKKETKNYHLNPDFKYQNIQELSLSNDHNFRHITQNSYIPNEFLILESDNSVKLYNLELDELNSIYTKNINNPYSFIRCDYLNHPKLASFINTSKLKLLDIRQKTKSNTIYTLKNDIFTACSPHPSILNQIITSTKNYLMLFDIRYTKKAMLRWNHHQNQYYPTEINIIPLSRNYTDFSSDIIMTWNQYNIISAYCYDPINIKQSNEDTTIMPPALSNLGIHIDSYTMEHKPTRFRYIKENVSLPQTSNILYPQKSFLKGLDYSLFMLDSKEDNLKKEITRTDQIGIKVFQYSDEEEIYFSTVSFSQPSKKKKSNKEVSIRIEEAAHNPSSLPKPTLDPDSKEYNKLKNKLRKKLISKLDGMKVSQDIKTKVLRRFEKINDVTYFDISKLNRKKLKKHGKFVVVKPRKLKDKSGKDFDPEYGIVSHTRYQIRPSIKYLDEMKTFNIIDLSSIYRYMVYETRMPLKSDTIHGHIHMTKKKIMNYIEDSASLVECNQKIKSLYEIHKRLSDMPIEYNDKRLPFFLPSHHLSINLDWTDEHFQEAFLSYMKKIYPNTSITSHQLYISPRPDSLIDMSDFASLFENLDLILPSPLYKNNRKAMISNKQVMTHSMVLAKVAYDLWSSSHICDISFKPNSKNKRNINSSYEAYISNNKKVTVNTTNNKDTQEVNSIQNNGPTQNSDKDNNADDNVHTNADDGLTNNENSKDNNTNDNENSSKKKENWLEQQIERFKTLNPKNQSVFLPIQTLEDIECERNIDHDEIDDEYRNLLLQSLDENELAQLEQEKGKKKGDEENDDILEENPTESLISLTKPKFISTSLSTLLIPAPGSASLLYDHWNKSSEEVVKEYQKLYSIEESKGQGQPEYEEEWINDGDEDEKYYISDSGDDEEVKFYKHPSNWGYYTKIKKMLEDMKSNESQQEITRVEEKNMKNEAFDSDEDSATFSDIMDRKELNSEPHLLSTSSFFDFHGFSSKYIDSSEGIQLLSSPQNPSTSIVPMDTKEEEEEEKGYDSLDEEIDNINLDDIIKNVLIYSQREEEKEKTSKLNSNVNPENEKETEDNLGQDQSTSQLLEDTKKEDERLIQVKEELLSSPVTSPITNLISDINPLERNPSHVSLFSQSQGSSQEQNPFQYSQPEFFSQPTIQTKTENIKEIYSSPSASQPKQLLSEVKDQNYFSASQPSLFHSGMKRSLKQTTLASTTTNNGKLLTIKRELPKVQHKRKRRKYGF